MKKRRTPPPQKKPRRHYRETAGLPPGSFVRTSEPKSDRTRIVLTTYSMAGSEAREVAVDDIPGPDADGATVQWVNVEGLGDLAVLETIGRQFRLHGLVMEGILNTDQRPKIEDYGSYVYVVVKVLARTGAGGDFTTEQASLVLGDGFVLSFCERKSDLFRPIAERIRTDVARIRKTGADYLLYALLDVIVDDYFVVLEELGEKIENAEDELIAQPNSDTLKSIYALKRQLLYLHKAVWPFREVIGSLERGETGLMKESTDVYLRDLYDHAIQVMDIADTQRDILSSMLDIYLSSVSNRMNEIMKVLTIISTIFMPLSFIVGLYGMNLFIPETKYHWMYPAIWGVMLAIAGSMMYFFKRKKWW